MSERNRRSLPVSVRKFTTLLTSSLLILLMILMLPAQALAIPGTANFGAAAVFNGVSTTYVSASALTDGKFVVAYQDKVGSPGTAVVGSINAPSVQTNPAGGITCSGATLNGNITGTGGEDCGQRGFQYRQQGAGAWTDSNESGRFGTGSFNQVISGLSPGTTYEFKARAQNSAGWS